VPRLNALDVIRVLLEDVLVADPPYIDPPAPSPASPEVGRRFFPLVSLVHYRPLPGGILPTFSAVGCCPAPAVLFLSALPPPRSKRPPPAFLLDPCFPRPFSFKVLEFPKLGSSRTLVTLLFEPIRQVRHISGLTVSPLLITFPQKLPQRVRPS